MELDGNWAKGYRRKASVLDAMGKHKESKAVYQKSLELTLADSSLSEDGRKKEVEEVEKLIAGFLIFFFFFLHPVDLPKLDAC